MGASRASLGPVGDLAAAIGTVDERHDERASFRLTGGQCNAGALNTDGTNTDGARAAGRKNKLVKWAFSTPSHALAARKTIRTFMYASGVEGTPSACASLGRGRSARRSATSSHIVYSMVSRA